MAMEDEFGKYCIVSLFIIKHSWQNAAIYSIRIKGYKRTIKHWD